MPFGTIKRELVEDVMNEALEEPVKEELKARYAVTFNICNNKYINGKKWDKYHDYSQASILLKKLKSYCTGFDCTIDYNNLVYERCPGTGQLHMHTVVETDDVNKIQELTDHVNDLHKPAKGAYTTFKFDRIYNEAGWKKYLNKDPYILK